HQVQRRHRCLALAADGMQHARQCNVADVVAGGIGEWAVLAEAGHAAEHQPWVEPEEHIGAEAEPLHDARAEALMRASALAARRSTTLRPASAFTSTAIERRPRCSTSNLTSRPGRPRSATSRRSTRITSAPMSASSMAANGAGPMPAISTMRYPARGPIAVAFRIVGWVSAKRVTHRWLRQTWWV